VWAFLGVSLVVIIVPGPDTVLMTRNAVLHGRRSGLGTGFVLIGLIWISGGGLAAANLSNVLRRPAIKAAIASTCGVVLEGLGALKHQKTAFAPRFERWRFRTHSARFSPLDGPETAIRLKLSESDADATDVQNGSELGGSGQICLHVPSSNNRMPAPRLAFAQCVGAATSQSAAAASVPSPAWSPSAE
jgi:hypothetical protein